MAKPARKVTAKRPTKGKGRTIRRVGPAKFIELARRYKLITYEQKTLKQEQEEIRAQLTDYLKAHTTKDNRTIIETDTDGTPYQVTLVEPKSPQMDWDGLMTVLTDEQWEAIQEKRPSSERLEDMVAQGAIDGDVVASYINEVPRNPYPKVT